MPGARSLRPALPPPPNTSVNQTFRLRPALKRPGACCHLNNNNRLYVRFPTDASRCNGEDSGIGQRMNE